jgi:hypothetical protein
MGVTISCEHNPEQSQRLKDAAQAVLEYFGAYGIVNEELIDLPESPHVAGVNKSRILKIGPDKVVLPSFFHGGGGTPYERAPIMPLLAGNKQIRIWFLERPPGELFLSGNATVWFVCWLIWSLAQGHGLRCLIINTRSRIVSTCMEPHSSRLSAPS